ncbi:ATP-dependent DNA helicase RecG [Labilithrix luteola]|uniref:ATP-dependent DNA helicase RecG n=2 Tax=Labilithrix luteola TaxID=1391654 RepID=A0A0K1Q9E8_9BACT|nr:ATP-dependent DNA helicase RecG [Labilithrix luteola]
MPFVRLSRMAKKWLVEPDPERLDALVISVREATAAVPDERRADWEKLLAGLARREDVERSRPRVEGLVRACRLFSRPRRKAAADGEGEARAPKKVVGPLDPVDMLPGLGPSARTALADHGLSTVADLVWLPPATWDDLREPMTIAAAVASARSVYESSGGAVKSSRVAVTGLVKSAAVVPIRGRRTVRVLVEDEEDGSCKLHAFWFFMAHGVLAAAKPGTRVLLVGRIEAPPKKPPRTAHPEFFLDTAEVRAVRARYGRFGPPEATLRKAIAWAVDEGITPDPLPPAISQRETMADASSVLREIHTRGAGAPPTEATRRAFLERLAWTEAFARVWERLRSESGEGRGVAAPACPRRADLQKKLEGELGFAFTKSQRSAIDAIAGELGEPRPMRRLLLGDVGTGKTAVALAAAAQCIAAGFQVAILAPTSVLAEQYLDAVKPLERAARARSAFVAAGVPAAARRKAENDLRTGEAQIAIGTHALLREGLEIARLGLVIVDEQQRLGVAQRLSLVKKGERPHLLTLSATPIPRTLALALRGELKTSTLDERPMGRLPVTTELAPSSRLQAIVQRVDEVCARGERVFWIVPRIESDPDDEDDTDPLATVVARAEALAKTLSSRKVSLLHGGLGAAAKRAAMTAFRRGDAEILVGTTVVEVGVDVPEATLIVIEGAEQFGLAQLHQLRGRVGRGSQPGTCVLVYTDPLEGPARARLKALEELSSGEAIARADLELRGAGDLGGTRQHGVEDELLYLQHGASYPWLARIDEDARDLFVTDPALQRPEHRVLGALVARFGHVLAVREEAG